MYFPATTKTHDEINNALPNLVTPSSTALEVSHAPPLAFIQLASASYVWHTVNPNDYTNSFSCTTDEFVRQVLNLFVLIMNSLLRKALFSF